MQIIWMRPVLSKHRHTFRETYGLNHAFLGFPVETGDLEHNVAVVQIWIACVSRRPVDRTVG